MNMKLIKKELNLQINNLLLKVDNFSLDLLNNQMTMNKKGINIYI